MVIMDYYINNHKLKCLKPNFHIKISLSINRFIGTWPPVLYPQRYFYLTYTLLSFIFMLGIYLTVQFINLTVIWGDIDRMVASAFLLMTNSVHAYKIIVILRNQSRIQRLFNILTSPLFTRDIVKYERIFTYYSWQGIYHHAIYQGLGTISCSVWSSRPITDAIAGVERRLIMESWYPYDTQESPAYELTCLHQAVAVMIACFHNVSMDTLITGFLNAACCQLEVIKHNLQSIDLKDDTLKEKEMKINRQQAIDELGRCIQHINVVMEFVMEIESIFSWVIMSQLSVNCLIICISAFHITKMNIFVPTEAFGMMMYICTMTYQIFIYCYHGNELALQSQSVSMAVFASNWWKFNKRFKQSIGILITRSHKAFIFTAGPLISLSLTTFMKILRMSYSFFTVLRSASENVN